MAKVKELTFSYRTHSESGKTISWRVIGTAGDYDIIGDIKWHGAWRKYIYIAYGRPLLAPDCLRAIADFCERETKRQLGPKVDWTTEECIRISGDIECELCGSPFWRHAPVAKKEAPTLVRACDGRLLKL